MGSVGTGLHRSIGLCLTLCVGAQEPSADVPVAAQTAPLRPIRVLYVDGDPSWSQRFLRNVLVRAKEIEAWTWLCDTRDGFVHPCSVGLKPLKRLPRTLKDLARIDVILIGDVPRVSLGKTESERVAWWQLIADFALKGGGVGFLAGPNAMTREYRGLLLEQMLLPVSLEAMSPADTKVGPPVEKPIDPDDPDDLPGGPQMGVKRSRLVPAEVRGQLHAILHVGADDTADREIWRRPVGMESFTLVRKLKRRSTAILVHEVDKNAHGPRILCAIGELGKGRSFFVAVPDTWRWRHPLGTQVYAKFWRNVVEYLGGDLASRTEPASTRSVEKR